MDEPRLMGQDDVSAAADLLLQAYETAAELSSLTRRIRHVLTTDPMGSWVVGESGRIHGLAQTVVRKRLWVLSVLAVAPTARGRGLGRGLLEAALGSLTPEHSGLIMSSEDPSAIQLYSNAGFYLHPAMIGRGRVARPGGQHAIVRRGDLSDLPFVEAVDPRGSERTTDISFLLSEGGQLILDDHDAFAVLMGSRLVTLVAKSTSAAQRILEAATAQTTTGTFQTGWLTAQDQWAMQCLTAAGVPLCPAGPLMTIGHPMPPGVLLPSGALG
jgi:GNAT superfamily N-acetyltransferase